MSEAVANLNALRGAIPPRDLIPDGVRCWQADNAHLAASTIRTYQAIRSAALNRASTSAG